MAGASPRPYPRRSAWRTPSAAALFLRNEKSHAMASHRDLFQRNVDEFWNQDNLDVADELYTDDHVYHDPNLPDLPPGPEGVEQRGRIYKAALPGRVTA